jgi:hypothetical protein
VSPTEHWPRRSGSAKKIYSLFRATLLNSSGNETIVRGGVNLQINAGKANNLGNHRVDARDENNTPGALKEGERALSIQ